MNPLRLPEPRSGARVRDPQRRRRFMERFNDPEIVHWIDERAWQRSVGVLACEFTRRPGAWRLERRDADRTRSRDGCATRFMESLDL